MSDISEIFDQIPIDQIAAQLGVSNTEAERGVALALPSLLNGLKANADDPSGAASILGALASKDTSLIDGGISLGDVDVADGEKIVKHIFGGAADEVPARLGGGSVGSGLIKQLLPILAPIVLAFVVKKMSGDGGGSSSGGGLTDILGGILGGATGGSGSLGNVLGEVLGGMADSGSSSKKSPSKSKSSSSDVLGGITDLLGGLLGGGSR